jgi:hypothetical protein
MELNPQKSLDDLEDAYRAYLSGTPEQRGELADTLQRSINRGEVEVGNLLARDAAADYEQRMLRKKLMCTVEMAKATIEEEGARR